MLSAARYSGCLSVSRALGATGDFQALHFWHTMRFARISDIEAFAQYI
jgi:hypothetical protein